MGKNFSCNNVTKQRKESDFYETPYSLTRLFLNNYEIFKGNSILEPSCGNGAITKVLKEFGYNNITEYDLNYGNSSKNFLDETNTYDTIITNPPFSLAFEFIKKAKELSNEVIMLLPLSYLHGKQRHDALYMDKKFPLHSVHVFTRYPLLGESLREDGKTRTGMMVYAWFCFLKNYEENSSIFWLDNNKFILKKGD